MYYKPIILDFSADSEVHVSPLSPTPPPRVKRKRTSPPEVQATLKEMKKLIRNDEDDDEENARMNDTINVKKPELQFVGGISKNSGSLSSQKKLHGKNKFVPRNCGHLDLQFS